jgi:hypothetical protein
MEEGARENPSRPPSPPLPEPPPKEVVGKEALKVRPPTSTNTTDPPPGLLQRLHGPRRHPPALWGHFLLLLQGFLPQGRPQASQVLVQLIILLVQC